MTKKPAILYLLWQTRDRAVLDAFRALRPDCVILTMRQALGEGDYPDTVLLDERMATLRPHCRMQYADVVSRLAEVWPDVGWKGLCEPEGIDAAYAGTLVEHAAAGEDGYAVGDLVAYLEALEEAAKEYAIELALVNDDVTQVARMTVRWAWGHDIPSLHLFHSNIIFRPFTVHQRVYADHIAVFGERALEGYRDLGANMSRFRITGNPAWDVYAGLRGQKKAVRRSLCARYRLSPPRPIVVFGTTWAAAMTSYGEADIYERTLAEFFAACRELEGRGWPLQVVVKDRQQTFEGNGDVVADLVREAGFSGTFVHVAGSPAEWVVAADLVVSVSSNLSVEAMLAGTPAIDLQSGLGMDLGPCFAVEDGVVEAWPQELAAAMERLLGDPDYRNERLRRMEARRPYFNVAVEGDAASRLAEWMASLAAAPRKAYLWQRYLGEDVTVGGNYHHLPRRDLLALLPAPPKRALDVGCGAGATAELLKRRYPGVWVAGIEANGIAAAKAATVVDRIFAGRFEDFDLERQGIAPGSLDLILFGDVLEHMYDPWRVLAAVRRYLAPEGVVVASIPNIRNLTVLDSLVNKRSWPYEPAGLLDITHIRFFTRATVEQLFAETGYTIEQMFHNIDPRLADVWRDNGRRAGGDLRLGNITVHDVSQDSLVELCTLQFQVVARPLGGDEDLDGGKDFYGEWMEGRELSASERRLFDARRSSWGEPVFHLAVLCLPLRETLLAATLRDLGAQEYSRLKITVIADRPPPPTWGQSGSLRWRVCGEEDLLATVFAALQEDEEADYVGTVDAGDGLPSHALLLYAEAFHVHPEWQAIYSDEDERQADGLRTRPHFKPDFNLDLLRSFHYTGGLVFLRRAFFSGLGGHDPALLGAEDHDLMLRAWERGGASAIGHLADVLYHRCQEGGHCRLPVAELVARGNRVLAAHLARCGLRGRLEPGAVPGTQRVHYAWPDKPSVSIVLAVGDDAVAAERCVESLFSHLGGMSPEVIAVGGEEAFLDGMAVLGREGLSVLRAGKDETVAARFNRGADAATGDYLVFAEDRCTFAEDGWLEALLAHGQRPEVGMVSPRFLGGEGRVSCFAPVAGGENLYETPFWGVAADYRGYFGRALLDQNVSLPCPACFLTPAADFRAVGGLDAAHFPRRHAVADYALRLGEAGRLIVATPSASVQLMPAEAVEAEAEDTLLVQRWRSRLAHDPSYNPNLSLRPEEPYLVELRPLLKWQPITWKPLPRLVTYRGDDFACGDYRIRLPSEAIDRAGLAQVWSIIHLHSPLELTRLGLDSVVLQRQVTDDQIDALRRHRRLGNYFMVYELDDLITHLPPRSVHNSTMLKDVAERLARGIPLCDRLVVSTAPLADAMRRLNGDIRVVPNFLPKSRWNHLLPKRRHGARPRVGWAGAMAHAGDLALIADVVRVLADEVDWIFFGLYPEGAESCVREYYPAVALEEYPAKLASLELDLALAPLELHPFNEAKSNLRLLEYGVLGYPVVCSDVEPYRGSLPVVRVRNRSREWLEAIRGLIRDRQALAAAGDELRRAVQRDWMLEDHLDIWLSAWLP